MFVLGNVLMGLGVALLWFFRFYTYVLIARAVISWVNADPRNPIVQFLHSVTDPLVRVIRRLLPTNLRYFPIDIAFLMLFALAIFCEFAIAQTLIDIGVRMHGPAPVSAI